MRVGFPPTVFPLLAISISYLGIERVCKAGIIEFFAFNTKLPDMSGVANPSILQHSKKPSMGLDLMITVSRV